MSNVTQRVTCTHSAARGLDIVSRLMAFVLCIYVAVTPVSVFAFSGNPLSFQTISNFVRSGGGATADYFFKDYAGTVYSSKGKVVNVSTLGNVAFKRILGLTAFGIVAGFVVDEIVSELTAEGWTVDTQNQEIFKTTGGWCVRTSTSPHPSVQSGQYIYCSDSPVAAVTQYLTYRNTKVKNDAFVQSSEGNYYRNYDHYSNPRLQGDIFTTTTAVEVRTDVAACNNEGCSLQPSFAQIFLDKVPTGKIIATPADVATVLPNVSDSQIESLLATPDYALEPHAPTIAAAAAAAAADAAPAGAGDCAARGMAYGTFNGTVHCVGNAPAGIQDNLSGETGTASDTSTGDAVGVGSGTSNPPITGNPPVTGNPPTTDNPPSDTPAFCTWAQTLCNWLNWTKEEPAKPAESVNKVPIAEMSESDILPNWDMSQQRVTFASQCPAGIPINFSFMGSSISTDFSYQPLCEFMSAIKPFVIASAYITGAYIIAGVGRGGGNDG